MPERPCKICHLSDRNTVHRNKQQSGYHPWVPVFTEQSSPTDLESTATAYVRDQLAVMDGSAEAGIRRIGTERYQEVINDVMKTMADMRHGV